MGDQRNVAQGGLASSIGTPLNLVDNKTANVHHPARKDGINNVGSTLCEIETWEHGEMLACTKDNQNLARGWREPHLMVPL